MRQCPECERSTEERTCPDDGMPTVLLELPALDPRHLEAGQVVAERWRVRHALGRGAHGTVYEVEHTLTRHVRALKVLARHSADGRATRRFFFEARALGRLSHAHVVRVDDFGQDDSGLVYLLMERLDGATLRTLVEQRGALEPSVALAIVRDVLEALEAVHTLGIVHRDLKPENVYLHRADGRLTVKLCDFGVAKVPGALLTHDGAHVIGTPAYMSPEQHEASSAVDARADVYAAGVVLFEALTGRRPFVSDSAAEVAAMHRRLPPPSVRAVAPWPLSPELDAAIAAAMTKDPEARPPSAAALRELLSRAPEWASAHLPPELLDTLRRSTATRSLDGGTLSPSPFVPATVASGASLDAARARPARSSPSTRAWWFLGAAAVGALSVGGALLVGRPDIEASTTRTTDVSATATPSAPSAEASASPTAPAPAPVDVAASASVSPTSAPVAAPPAAPHVASDADATPAASKATPRLASSSTTARPATRAPSSIPPYRRQR